MGGTLERELKETKKSFKKFWVGNFELPRILLFIQMKLTYEHVKG
jgi:hypothetical protein